MAKKLHGGAETQVVAAFQADDLGAPFRVILTNCVSVTVDTSTGEMLDYTIPDFEGLVRTVAMARLVHDRKLSGAELRFLRKSVGVAQVDLARVLDCKPEHLSKVEGGKYPLTSMAERWARMFLFEKAAKLHKMEEGELKNKLHELMENMFEGLKPVAAFAPEELEFVFHRDSRASSIIENDAAANDDWTESETSADWSNSSHLQTACG